MQLTSPVLVGRISENKIIFGVDDSYTSVYVYDKLAVFSVWKGKVAFASKGVSCSAAWVA
jgi:hypothetical protein